MLKLGTLDFRVDFQRRCAAEFRPTITMKKTITALGAVLMASSMSASAAVLVAGWHTFATNSAWVPNELAADTTSTVVNTTELNPWNRWNNNNGSGLGQGASADGTYGDLSSATASAPTIHTGSGLNASLNSSNGSIIITLTNDSGFDRILEGFYFDSIYKNGNPANAWSLTLSEAVTGSANGTISNAANMYDSNAAQRNKGIDLSGIADNVWEAGQDAVFTLAFTGALNDSSGGGKEMVIDNIGITVVAIPEPSTALLGLGALGLLARRRRNA